MGLPDSSIPEESLPQCWSDDVRMNALFAPFRLKTANPESWDMKMKFWSDMLRVWCKCKKGPLVSASDAKFAFQRKGRTPACIDIVVEEMFRNGELSPISKYQQYLHNGPEGWMRWGTRLAFKPAAIALTAVASLLPARQATDTDGLPKASIDPTMRLVLESAVQEQATELLQNYPHGAERIGTVEELMRNSNWQHGRDTFEVLLGYLVSVGSAVKKEDVVKLAEPNKKASPVTESDEAIVKLLSAETRLSRDADKLSRDISACEGEARAALQTGNRVAAKNHLRRKHQLSARAVKCESALENVRQLLLHMKETDTNSAIFDTYKTTSQAMKRNMTETGLDEDTVHDTMDELRDVMESINEVEKALAGPAAAEDLDQAELEQELKDLLAGGGDGGGTPVKKQAVPTLPSPPRDRPAPARVSERDFVFDGEERVLAELNELGIDDASPRDRKAPSKAAKEKIPLADGWAGKSPQRKAQQPAAATSRPSQTWYPPSHQFTEPEEAWNNNLDTSFELRLDDRLHPGQPLNVDFTSPARLYNTDFVVPDHKMADGVWLYNSKDDNSNVPGNNRVQPGNTCVQPGNTCVQPDNTFVQKDVTRIPTNKFLYNSKDTDIEEYNLISDGNSCVQTDNTCVQKDTHIRSGKTPGRKNVPSNSNILVNDNTPFDNSIFGANIPSGNTQILPGTRNATNIPSGNTQILPGTRNATNIPSGNTQILPGTRNATNIPSGNTQILPGTRNATNIPSGNTQILPGTRNATNIPSGNTQILPGTRNVTNIPSGNTQILPGTRNATNIPSGNTQILPGTRNVTNIPSGNTQILPGTRNVTNMRSTDSSVPDIRNLTAVNRNLARGFSTLPTTEDSTEFDSPSSPGKSIGSFQMAPGGERKHSNAWNADDTPLDDLEARLRNLRGFNL